MRSRLLGLLVFVALPAVAAGSTFSGWSEGYGLCVSPFPCFVHLDVTAVGEPCAPTCTYMVYDHAYSEHVLPHDLWVERDEYAPALGGGFALIGRDIFGYDQATMGPNETFLGFWHESFQWQFTPHVGSCEWFGDLARMTTPFPTSSTMIETPRVYWKVCMGAGETVVSAWSGP